MVFKSTRTSLSLLCLILTLLFVNISCQKELDFQAGEVTPVKNNLTVEGLITDDSGRPMQNVIVQAGSQQVMTDANGSFRAVNASFSTSETFVTAHKDGYFPGSRTFIARAGSNNYVRIQLMPRVEAATMNATTGGTANVGAGSVTFLPNSFVNASGASYSGSVSVKASYIDPASPAVNQRMPGDLRGLRTSGELRGLRRFGMMVVELEGAAGEKLQLKAGSLATLSFPITASMNTTAPSTIPLWYYDETKGLWKEEGSATRAGNRYVGTVSHFSFWNVDDPFEYVLVSMRVVNGNQQPLAYAKVELTSNADSSTSYDYTDNNGYIDGYVPKNVSLTREVFDDCNNSISTTAIGPFATSTSLADLTVAYIPNQKTITGTVVNCSNLPLAHGYVSINMPGKTIYSTVTNGSFSSTFIACSGISSATLTAVDDSTLQQGSPVTVSLNTATAAAGQLTACGTTIQSFITITVDSATRTWNLAPYDLFAVEDTVPNAGTYQLDIVAWDSINGSGPIISLIKPQANFTAPGTMNFMSMSIYDPLAAPNMIGDYFVDSFTQQPLVTSYGSVGQYIAGSFSGTFIRNNQPISDTVTVSCSFKVKRVPF